jgi:GTPase SAR1 family protein
MAIGGLPTFKKASDLAGATGLGLLIFGPPGVGKTTLASSAQQSELGRDAILFELDPNGYESVTDIDIPIWPTPEDGEVTYKEFRDIVDKLVGAKDKGPFKTIIVDSISAVYYDYILTKLTGSREKQPTQAQWGEANRIMIKLMMDLLSLTKFGINVIFIGHSMDQQDEESTIKYLAGTPKGRDEILRNIGRVGYYDYDRRKVDRVLTFKPQRKVEGPKWRQPRTGDQMPLEFTNPTMHDILKYAGTS